MKIKSIFLISIYLDWYEQKLAPSYFFCKYKIYLSYVNLSGLVQTKIAPLLFFCKNYSYVL